MVQKYKLHSDSSHRFERGVDPSNVVLAAGRVNFFLKKYANAQKRGAFQYVIAKGAESLFDKKSLNLDLREFLKVVGVEVTGETVATKLRALGFSCEIKSTNLVKVEVPLHRCDILREIDLIEEVARVVGFDKIPSRFPSQYQENKGLTSNIYRRVRQLRSSMLKTGAVEVMPYSFVSQKELSYAISSKAVELSNSMSSEWACMRPNLSFGMLGVLKRHVSLNQYRGSFFEVGTVFELGDETKEGLASPCKENIHACVAMMGNRMNDSWHTPHDASKKQVDFFDAKAYVNRLFEALEHTDPALKGRRMMALWECLERPELMETIKTTAPWLPVELLHPGKSVIITVRKGRDEKVLGYIGELIPSKTHELLNLPHGLKLNVVLGELSCFKNYWNNTKLNGDFAGVLKKGKIARFERLPIVERDLAFVVPKDFQSLKLEALINKTTSPYLLETYCMDVFPLENDQVSLAFKMKLQDPEKTLDEARIQKMLDQIISKAKSKLGIGLRG